MAVPIVTLVFIHGAGCCADVFRAQTQAFSGAIALTLPGHAGDDAEPATIGQFADAVSGELDARRCDGVILCGSSMGGAVALELALRNDARIHGIALIGSGAKLRVAPALFERLERDFSAAVSSLAAMFFADPAPDRVDAATSMMLRVGQAQTVRDFRACDAFDASERIAALRLPLLALAGDRDALTPPKFAEFLASRIPGASARILKDAGHLAMVERPDETNDALRAFVNRIQNC